MAENLQTMSDTIEDKNDGLDVKFYPIRNRYLERSVHGLSRLLKVIFIFCAVIVLVVIADFSGYALEDVKKLFGYGITQIDATEENALLQSGRGSDTESMYAGHSISAQSPGQMHNRQSLQTYFMAENPDSLNRLSGYFGIDVSHWQQNINWEQVTRDTIPQRIDFSIVKATQGADQVDPNFAVNWKQSTDHFALAGAYHFYIYSDSPKAQAQNFLDTVDLSEGNFLPIVDVEYNCSNCDSIMVAEGQLINDLKIFLDEIESHYNSKAIIYTNTMFYNRYLAGHFDSYPYWLAKYEKEPPTGLVGYQSAETDSGSASALIWQFSDYERLNGIVGKVDMNFLPEQALQSIQFVK